MSNFWRPSAPWKCTKYGYQVTMSDIKPFVKNGYVPAPGIVMKNMNEFRPTYGSDFTEILYWQFVQVGPGVHKFPAPGIGMWSMNEFRPKYGSDFTEILYWQFVQVGPGVHKTTYIIWNK